MPRTVGQDGMRNPQPTYRWLVHRAKGVGGISLHACHVRHTFYLQAVLITPPSGHSCTDEVSAKLTCDLFPPPLYEASETQNDNSERKEEVTPEGVNTGGWSVKN